MTLAKRILSISLALFMCLGFFQVIGLAEGTETSEHLTEVPEGYVGVYTKDDLDYVRLNMSGKYILMNDIVFEDSDFVKGGTFYNSGKGWEPIGTPSTNFTGIFDGNGYKISNLYINDTEQDYMGLFGYIDSAIVKNIALENGSITGGNYVGGIVGEISNSCVENCVNSAQIKGKKDVGGVVGFSYDADVKFCSNSGDVIADGSNVGGVVGQFFSPKNRRYIECCYNSGNVSGVSLVGGVAGYPCYNYSHTIHCYSVGKITAKTDFGGCFGSTPRYNDFCYYLDAGVENPTCTVGIPKSEDQLKRITAYEQWDFATVWTMAGDADYPYPELVNAPRLWTSGHEHTYTVRITKPATHTETGILTYTCSCGYSYTETIAKDIGHNYEAVITAPTCHEQGYTTYTCECGDAYIGDYVSAKGHTSSGWIVDQKVTVNYNGVQHKECTVCGEILETATIKQLKCGAVTLTKVANVDTGVRVYWSKTSGADSYRVYRKTKSSGWKVLGETSKAYFTDKTAKSGTVYYYSVRAINEAGLGAVCKTTKSIKCLADPALKVPTSTRSGITLKWTKTTGASGYVIYRKAGNGSWKKLVTEKGVSNLSYIDKTAKKGTTYTYKIRAYYGSTYSAYSNTRQIKDKY